MSVPTINGRAVFIPEALTAFEAVTRNPPLPTTFYHYTTADGLIGILRSEALWATNALYMNDTSELAYGREIVAKVLTEEAKLSGTVTSRWLLQFAELLGRVHDRSETYVACFCEDGDLLSQWRAYSAGRGFSLGFSGARLSALGYALFRVEYARLVQEEAIRNTVRIHIREFEAAVQRRDSERVVEVSGAFGFMLALWTVACKHPTFAEEKEWRMTPLVNTQEVRVRNDRGWLRPYIELSVHRDNEPMPLAVIMHGPSPHPDLEKRSLSLLVADTSYRDVRVSGSTVPLRV